jgi:hypothetical protein
MFFIKNKNFSLFFIIVLVACSCATSNNDVLYSVSECPSNIREKVVFYAKEYAKKNTLFELGARDLLEKEGILEVDCSGLIVRVFQYAVKDTKYSLLFEDTNVSSFYSYFTIPVVSPTPGDLIFMGTNTKYPTHMSIFIKMDNENIYFIDSTYKEDEGIDGVTLRYYKKDDPKFLQFARLLLRSNK